MIVKAILLHSFKAAYQQQYRFLSSTIAIATSSSASKTILHRLSADQPKNESWLEQKLNSERLAKSAENEALSSSNKSSKSIKSRRPRSSPGFVKINGSENDSRDRKRSVDQEGAATTLTEKALESKIKWQESNSVKKKMQDRLKDDSLEGWKRRKIELKLKLGNEAWSPEKKIAVSSMEKIRLLNAEFPDVWTLKRLSEEFKVSQESIRRIIKSKYRPSADKIEKREQKRKARIHSYKLEERAESTEEAKSNEAKV
ncbi:Required for respiratory growth protein 9 mitochondrial [Coemansia asiatica]|uniref:Required for respiratory growth protein 9, mitochondrial n=1 Tax=Coemansia asiatica TaxID=1052880 RepID=A0A9W8CHG1_9FUNG|nr:Required for respiratory growth protein 9 mitochondrial [Coemansia asiatica]